MVYDSCMTTKSLAIKYNPAEVEPVEWSPQYERGFRFYRYVGLSNHEKVAGYEFIRGLPIDTLYTSGLANKNDEDQDLVTVLLAIYVFPQYLSFQTLKETLASALFEMKNQSHYTYIHTGIFQGMDRNIVSQILTDLEFIKVMLKENNGKRVWTGWMISQNF